MSDELDEVKRRLFEAMGGERPDWLDFACRVLYADHKQRVGRRIYDISTVGLRIKCAREVLGMSQDQLGLRLRVPGVRVSDWERGRADLPVTKLRPLSIILRVSAEWIAMDSEEGGPDVPTEVRVREHSPRWLEWRERRRAYRKACEEAERRNAARKARQQQESAK